MYIYTYMSDALAGAGAPLDIHIYTATPCNTLYHPATPCNTLQHPATPYNTLQLTSTHTDTHTPANLECLDAAVYCSTVCVLDTATH